MSDPFNPMEGMGFGPPSAEDCKARLRKEALSLAKMFLSKDSNLDLEDLEHIAFLSKKLFLMAEVSKTLGTLRMDAISEYVEGSNGALPPRRVAVQAEQLPSLPDGFDFNSILRDKKGGQDHA